MMAGIGDRVLFLSADPQLIERQLRGERLTLADAGPLRDNVSTDEITPTTSVIAGAKGSGWIVSQ